MSIAAVRGFRDLLGTSARLARQVEESSSKVLESYGFSEIGLPVLERTELFARSLGDTTDIVEKEMYTFPDRDGTLVTLRPEGTASVVRAFVEHHLDQKDAVNRLYYLGPMFRHERPQKGRHRQFHQIGAEVIGRDDPLADAELLVCLRDILVACGVERFRLLLNSLGDEVCRPPYRELLRAFLLERAGQLCENCVRRIEKNPLRVLDCKEAGCRQASADAPRLGDHLCPPCADHFADLKRLLDAQGIEYEVEPRLVRGLDYYVRTAFEVTAEGLGAQAAIGAGGRYDGLVSELGGPSVPGIGFALGVERVILALQAAKPTIEEETARSLEPAVFIAALDEAAETDALAIAVRLRRLGVRVELDGRRSLKSLMRRADRLGAARVLILGQDEVAVRKGTLRDMVAKTDRKQSVDFDLDGPALLGAVGVAQ